jgi:hypothetical protein
METAKVDIRKLQILNDRIAQTIDALNQVRLSVHGVSASPSIGAYGFQSPFGIAAGLGHTGAWSPQAALSQAAMLNSYYASPWGAQSAYSASAYAPYAAAAAAAAAAQQSWGLNGIGHSSPDASFPFAAWAYSPYAAASYAASPFAAAAYGASPFSAGIY